VDILRFDDWDNIVHIVHLHPKATAHIAPCSSADAVCDPDAVANPDTVANLDATADQYADLDTDANACADSDVTPQRGVIL
jgi:hypothetical protein